MATAIGIQAPAFRRVIVPLDGSSVAEEIFPHLRRIKDGIDELLLLHIVPPVSLPTGASPTIQTKLALQAERYLIKAHDLAPRRKIRLRVETGSPAERILAVCQEVEADLVAMTTHSKSGLGPVLFGGTARQLLNVLNIPVLLVRPGMPRPRNAIERILLPIGTEAGEETLLEPVARLARNLHSELTLLRANPIIVSQDPITGIVLPLPFGAGPQPSPPSLEELSHAHPGIRSQVITVQGDVAPMILEQVKKMHVDLVAMTTHARRGVDRLLSGSFAEEVLRGCETPVLLQHVERS